MASAVAAPTGSVDEAATPFVASAAPGADAPAPPTASTSLVPVTPAAEPDTAGFPSGAESDLKPDEIEVHPGLWSRRSTRVVAGLLIVVLVAAIAWLVLGHKHSNGGSPTPAVGLTQPTTQASASQSTTTTSASPLTAAQMTQFDGYATALEKANATAASGLAGLSNPTVAQVTPVISTYMTAANLYNLEIHTVPWPASMQADVQANYAQWSAFRGFLQSESTVTQAALAAWLSQLHSVGAATQATDNTVRHDLGAAASSSFP
jgi:hypothetical protein